ncbi:MAG TPA: 3-phosphoglycerate dehydrogenase, partial [Acholeplasmataceae bacterium]|nr:3-phosphoglycerate dehydrogenase [Acholeplasmataceae bacterium]
MKDKMGDAMYKIHCLNSISKVGLKTLPENYPLTDQIDGATAILVRSAVMHELELPKSVKVVARAGAGVNNIPLDQYAKKGIVVFNTPGANANAVKELTLAGMLLASRDIVGGISWVKDHQEDPEIAKSVEKAKAQFGGTEIKGKTIGIIGLGAIGMELANMLDGFEANVIAYDAFPNPELTKTHKFNYVSLNKLYSDSDVISLHVPLFPTTYHMINKSAVKKMKDGVYIINT